jgi:hypothetical protein
MVIIYCLFCDNHSIYIAAEDWTFILVFTYSCNCICCLIVCGVSFIVFVDLCAVFCLCVVCYFV